VVPMGVHLPGKLKWHGNPVRPCGPSGCKSLEQGPSFARIPTGILIPMIVILSATTLFEYFQENVFGTTTADVILSILLALFVTLMGCFFLSIVLKWLLFGRVQPGIELEEGMCLILVSDLVTRFKSIADMVLMSVYNHTPLINLILYLYGGKMAISAHAAAILYDPLEADLIQVADNVEISVTRFQCCEISYNGCTVTRRFGPIAIGRNAEIGFQVCLEANSLVEEGASVGFITRVPAHTAIRKNTVLYGNPGVTMKKRNMEQRDTIISLTMIDWIMRNTFNVAFRLVVLCAIVVVSGVGAWQLSKLILPDLNDWVYNMAGEQRKDYRDVQAFNATICLVVMVSLFGLISFMASVVFKWLIMGCFTKQSVQRYDLYVQLYHSYTVLTATFNGLILSAASGTWLSRLVYKAYGANVNICGKAIIWGTCLDQDLIFIGDKSVIGEDTGICGHNYEHAGLKFAPTVVAQHCTIYCNSLLMAGDTMRDFSTLASKSKPFGANDPCESDTMNVGCPARWATFVDTAQDSDYHCNIAAITEGVEDVTPRPSSGSVDGMNTTLLGGVRATSNTASTGRSKRENPARSGGNATADQGYERLL